MGDLLLSGCTTEPLGAYLKGLGLFRLVAEQRDPTVCAHWSRGMLVVSTDLDREGLLQFLLHEYRPTPVVAPWNGGSGFGEKDNREALNAILASSDSRFAAYREVIEQARVILASAAGTKHADLKESILTACRNSLPDAALDWLDAAYVLTSGRPHYPPLLGTGGNDGRLEFSNNFMQNLVTTLSIGTAGTPVSRRRTPQADGARDWLVKALFEEGAPALLRDRTIGQFVPGSVGGPNATAGSGAGGMTNPWDYVLTIEGTMLFAGSVARRLSPESRSKAAFPFTVDTSAAGYGTAVDAEYSNAARSEVWLPLWDRPASYREVTRLFAEGRAQLGARQAATGADFARAIAGLGVERGVSQFERYGFLMRSGRAYLALPLGRFPVHANPHADLLHDVDGWLRDLRSLARGRDAPEALRRRLREIEAAILRLCQDRAGTDGGAGAASVQEVLVAMGRTQESLSSSRAKTRLPMPTLRREWAVAASDGSPEFRIASAIASIRGNRTGEIGPVRTNIDPVVRRGRQWQWQERDPSVVWHGVDLVRDLEAVLERRCLDARVRGVSEDENLPVKGEEGARPQDVLDFLEDRLDDRRIAALVLPLSAVDWGEERGNAERRSSGGAALPLAYALLKLVFMPWRLRRAPGAPDVAIRPEPSILPLLRAGRVDDACRVASRRLYSSGLAPLDAGSGIPGRIARRLAGSLLIPVEYQDMFLLADVALMPAREGV